MPISLTAEDLKTAEIPCPSCEGLPTVRESATATVTLEGEGEIEETNERRECGCGRLKVNVTSNRSGDNIDVYLGPAPPAS